MAAIKGVTGSIQLTTCVGYAVFAIVLVWPLLGLKKKEGRWNVATLVLEGVIIVSAAVMWKNSIKLNSRVFQPWVLILTKYSTAGQLNREQRSTAAGLTDDKSTLAIVAEGVSLNAVSCTMQAVMWPMPLFVEHNLAAYIYVFISFHNAYVFVQSIAIAVMTLSYVVQDLVEEYPRFVRDTATNYIHPFKLNTKCEMKKQNRSKTDDFQDASDSWTNLMIKKSCCFHDATSLGPNIPVACQRIVAFNMTRPLPCCKKETKPGSDVVTYTDVMSCLRASDPNEHVVKKSCVDELEEFVKEQAETITKMASLSMALHFVLTVYGIVRLVVVWQALAAQLKERRETANEPERRPSLTALTSLLDIAKDTVEARALSLSSLYRTPTTGNVTSDTTVE